jgi:uncharacterized protein YjbI with pentapeptide repeats
VEAAQSDEPGMLAPKRYATGHHPGVQDCKSMKLHRVTEKLDVNDADLSGSQFNDANLSGTTFNQINFSGARFNDSNLTGWQVNDVNLSGSVFQNLNLSGAVLNNCRLTGVTIDGVPLDEMIAAWRQSKGA